MASVTPGKTAVPAVPANGSGSLTAGQPNLAQATRSSSMDSLESSMSTTESNAGEAENSRLITVIQENTMLRSEVEMLRAKCKHLMEENRRLKQASITIQAQAEQEEEFISNTLLKKIHSLKKEKEALAMNYEQEEEFLTNDLSRKLAQVEQEKRELEGRLGATPPPSPSDPNSPVVLNSRIMELSTEVNKLKAMLTDTKVKSKEKITQIEEEERVLKEENVRLQRRLLRETERREQLTRQLSESESSLEMDDERHFNEMASGRVFHPTSPSPYSPSPTRRSLSPSPALFSSSGPVFPPSPPLRGRTHSFGAYPPHIHAAANRHLHMSSVSASSLSGNTPGASAHPRRRAQSGSGSGYAKSRKHLDSSPSSNTS